MAHATPWTITTEEERAQEGMFDRDLCDIPYSGDGTARKNPGIWRTWNCLGRLTLHPLQINIAMSGVRLSKVGGYMCYSTCSMNPIENEAVVAQILRLTNGALELVDKREEMKGFIGRRGWTSWKVMSEKKRKRDITNKMKKNNAKMQESRKQWEDPNTKSDKIDGDEAISSAEAKFGNAGESNKKSDIDDQEKEATLEQGKDLKKDGEDVKNGEPEKEPKLEQGEDVKEVVENDVWVSSPPSWNEADLLKRAQTRGLIQYDSWKEVPEIARGRIRESCFPPTQEEIEKFQLL